MSYNGVGLSTPRGSGTNGAVCIVSCTYAHLCSPSLLLYTGHITKNRSTIRIRDNFDKDTSFADKYASRPPDAGILEHERKRRVEVKCLELQDSLEEDGVAEEEVEKAVQTLREKLLAESSGKSGRDRDVGSIKGFERHELAQANELKNEKLRLAMRIGKDHVEGLAFDKEKQAEIRVAKMEERAKNEVERRRIEAELKIEREKANVEREAQRVVMEAAGRKAREEQAERRRLDSLKTKEERTQDELKRLDAELDSRKRRPSPPRDDGSKLPYDDDEAAPSLRRRSSSPNPLPYHHRNRTHSPMRSSVSRRDARRSPAPVSSRRSRSPSPRRSRSPERSNPRRRGRSPSRSRSRSRSDRGSSRSSYDSRSRSRSRSLSPPRRRARRDSPVRGGDRSPARGGGRERSRSPERRR